MENGRLRTTVDHRSPETAKNPCLKQTVTPTGQTLGMASTYGATNTVKSADTLTRVNELIAEGLAFAGESAHKRYFNRTVDELVDLDGELAAGSAERRPHELLEASTLTRLSALWESGWQPFDVAHVVRRACNPRVAHLAICAMRAELQQSGRVSLAPASWLSQLASLQATLPHTQLSRLESCPFDPMDAPFAAWQRADRLSTADLLEDALLLLSTIRFLQPLSILMDPPSRWNANSVPPNPAESAAQDRKVASEKMLATVRALLAKAEGTNYPAEAEAFAAKAQELMTRYSIDAAMLDDRHGDALAAGVRAQRFHLEQPYAKEKVSLLSVVGSANRVRIVFQDAYAIAHAVGFEEDLEVTDLLYTSLLVQASRAITSTTAVAGRSSRASSPAFRRAFWLAYANRIGERLEEAQERAQSESQSTYGSALVPLLQERSDAVTARVDEMFGKLRQMKSRRLDAEGWFAGRDAAESASLAVANGRLNR